MREAVFVSDDGEFSYFSGRFAAQWVSKSDPGLTEEGPQGVEVEEAIAWGRDRSSVVVVYVGDGDRCFSAGSTQPPDRVLPAWPPGGVRSARARKAARSRAISLQN